MLSLSVRYFSCLSASVYVVIPAASKKLSLEEASPSVLISPWLTSSPTTTPLDLVKEANSFNLSLSFSALAAASTFKISPASLSPSAIILPVVTSTFFFLFSNFISSISVSTSRFSSTFFSNTVLVSTIFASGFSLISSLILTSFVFLLSILSIKEVVEFSGPPSSSKIGVPPKVLSFSFVFDNICLPSTLFGSIPCLTSVSLFSMSIFSTGSFSIALTCISSFLLLPV